MTNRNTNIVSLLHQRAIQNPDKIAYFFLKDGKTIGSSITYGELDKKAKAIAATLQSQVTSGSRALLVYSSSEEFLPAFFACLYAKIIAVPTPSLDAVRVKRALPRIEAIAKDSQVTLILSTSRLVSQLEEVCTQIGQLQSTPILVTSAINSEDAIKFKLINDLRFNNVTIIWLLLREIDYMTGILFLRKFLIASKDVAYLQYTSGSTSTPKGVMITHENLMDNLACITNTYDYNEASIVANWMPYFHDYALVMQLIHSLYAGITCYEMSPITFIKRPIRWLEAISHYKVTHTAGPNFAYDYCVSQFKVEQLTEIDLSSWRVAHTGAEPIRSETLIQFAQTFKPYGFNGDIFYPAYGLAEATLIVTTRKQSDCPFFLNISTQDLAKNKIVEISEKQNKIETQTLTSCGSPIGNTKVIIVNPETLTQSSVDEVGEIWVSSNSVASGYWNRLSETQQTFQASLPDFPENSFLRTGDLGFLNNGQLFVTGRSKDLIIIRGQNYYPQDIELTVEKSHPQLRANSSAVFSVNVEGVEQLILTAEVDSRADRNLNKNEIIEAIRHAMAKNYELPLNEIVLLKRGSIPKTSSGKIQRHACRQAFINGSLDTIATWTLDLETAKSVVVPRNEYEFRLQQIWQEVLGLESISIHDNFFELGGNSLRAANVLAKVESKFSQTIPLSALSEASTIEQLANYLDKPNWSSSPRSLVAIKPQGNKRPFFYVHPRSGTVMLLGNLARYLDPERPFYGLQAVGLNGEKDPLTRIEDMAAYYIKEIQTVQPEGPYLLGGRCFGGKVALEMAHQLLAKDHQVLMLILVESPRTSVMDPVLIKKIKQNMEKMRKLSISQVSNFQKVMNANDQAIYNYKSKVYPGRISYFCAENPWHDSSFGFGWAELAMGEFKIYEIPGDHMNIDEEPNVQILANKLSIYLDQSELKSEIPNIYLMQGYCQHQQGNLEEAIIHYQKALQVEHDNPQLYFMLGNAQKQQEKLEEAIASYQKAIELEPKHYWYYQSLAEIFRLQGQLKSVLSIYQKLITLNPEHPSGYKLLGNAQRKSGDLQGAISNYQLAIKLRPTNSRFYFTLGQILREQDKIAEAIVAYQRAIELQPLHFQSYIELGNCYHQKKTWEKAITNYRQAIELRPNNPRVYFALGQVLGKQKNWGEAITNYQKALDLNHPNPFKIYKFLGDVLTEINETKPAISAYQQALVLKPNHSKIKKILKKLIEQD